MSRCGHVGRLSAYTEAMAEQGLIGFAFVNAGGKESRVAPFGGARPVYGTNPLSIAMPSDDMGPIAVDFSTATIAAGKMRVLKNKGENLPEGAISTEKDGHRRIPTTITRVACASRGRAQGSGLASWSRRWVEC